MRYKFICEYNGFAFSGWQKQTIDGVICRKTVQSELENAFSIALRQKINIIGAGRTDAGVHAKGQVAHFDITDENLTAKLNCNTLEKSVNALSDKNVCIKNLEICSESFHARYSAKEKYYTYTLSSTPIALGREYVWECGYKLNKELMQNEANSFLGVHDFNAFSIPRNDNKGTECNITKFDLDSKLLRWHIVGNRFLHKQIRSMVGVLFDVGRGYHKSGVVNEIFSGNFKKERTWALPQGLLLEEVRY